MRDAFEDPASGPVRLLVETTEPVVGQAVRVAPLNETDRAYLYGEGYVLERFEDGKWLPSDDYETAARDIGLGLPPRSVGLCFTVRTSEDAPEGRYRIVSKLYPEPTGNAGVELVRAEIRVSDG